MRYAIRFKWRDEWLEDIIEVDNAKERDFNIKEMLVEQDFDLITYCNVYANGEHGVEKIVLDETKPLLNR